MHAQRTLILFLLLTLIQCTPHYISSNFDTVTDDHKVIAILPFEMVYTGNQPDELTEEDMLAIYSAESRAFQISLYNEIHRSTKSGRKPIRVSLQDYRATLRHLAENDIDIHDSCRALPRDLAEMLFVDAVIMARVEKHRLMPDLASYGIEVGADILDLMTDQPLWPWLPHEMTRAKEIKADFSLIDRNRGRVLWSVALEVNADWRLSSNEIIDDINRRAANKFPYRN